MTDPLTSAYTERTQLIAALAVIYPSSIETDPNYPDWPLCIIDLPTGQASWHIAAHDLHHLAHVPRQQGRTWDGHSTPEKYARLHRDVFLPDHGMYITQRPGR